MLLSGHSSHIFAADIFYHLKCYFCFSARAVERLLKTLSPEEVKIKMNHFSEHIYLKIICHKEAYLLYELLKSVISIFGKLKRIQKSVRIF